MSLLIAAWEFIVRRVFAQTCSVISVFMHTMPWYRAVRDATIIRHFVLVVIRSRTVRVATTTRHFVLLVIQSWHLLSWAIVGWAGLTFPRASKKEDN
jgi:hypothetical protein